MRAPKRALGLSAIALVVALAFFIIPAVTDSGEKASAEWPYTLIYYDGHMHTYRSDGTGSVADIKATALARGLSAVIITDHCTSLTQAEWASLKAETTAVSDASFLALPAFEITGSEGIFNRGHMNAYNAPDPFVGDDALEQCPEEVWTDPPNLNGTGANAASLKAWAEYVHGQGGIVNHNHTSGSTQLSYGVDNIEIYNQGHVDDVASYARLLHFPAQMAWLFGITLNNFAIYGERDVNMPVPFPGIDDDFDGSVDEDPPDGIDNDGDTKVDEDGPVSPLRLVLYAATKMLTGVGQWLGSPQAPLNSWDQLLMAYVNGEVDKPIFAVANSDAHNTAFSDPDHDGNVGEDPIDGHDNDGDCVKDTNKDGVLCDCLGGPGLFCDDGVDEDPLSGDNPLDSNVGVAKNGLYVLALTPRQVYKAIEAGRSFATTGPSLNVDVNGALMGGTAYISKGGSANLNLSVNSESPTAVLAKIDIVKNGDVVDTFGPMSSTFEETLTDTVTERGYYRVEVTAVDMATGAYQFAYSNPVFVKCPFDDDCDGYLNLIERLLGSDPDDSTSTPESIFVPGTCKDKVDNDGDTLTDAADPGCRWAW